MRGPRVHVLPFAKDTLDKKSWFVERSLFSGKISRHPTQMTLFGNLRAQLLSSF
jgi:hypothetical protein